MEERGVDCRCDLRYTKEGPCESIRRQVRNERTSGWELFCVLNPELTTFGNGWNGGIGLQSLSGTLCRTMPDL